MSRVILVCGSAPNSDQLQALTERGPTFRVNVQASDSIRGVGPAERTGKPSTRCWPGGIRSETSGPAWRRVNPRVTRAGTSNDRRKLRPPASLTEEQSRLATLIRYNLKFGR